MVLADREKMGGSQFPTIPLIRLANKDMKQAPEGEYFIETRKGKDEEPDIRVIGPNPEIVVLYKTNTYSYYTPEDGLVAWTSDIHGFNSLDAVTLYRRKGDKVSIDFDGVWPEFKKHKEAKYETIDPVTDRVKKLLKYKTVAYVLFEGKPYKMFFTNASAVGVDAEGLPSFKNPQPKSLESFLKQCWFDKRMHYEFAVTLGSQFIEGSKPYYIIKLLKGRDLSAEELSVSLKASKDVELAVMAIDESRKRKVLDDSERPAVTPAEAAEVFADEPHHVLEA